MRTLPCAGAPDCGRYTYLNPGSVALPKENSPHSCMVLEDGQFTWLDVVTGQPLPAPWMTVLLDAA